MQEELSEDEIRLAVRLAALNRLKAFRENTGVPALIEASEKMLEIALLAVPPGPRLQHVLDNFAQIAAGHHVEVTFDPKAQDYEDE